MDKWVVDGWTDGGQTDGRVVGFLRRKKLVH